MNAIKLGYNSGYIMIAKLFMYGTVSMHPNLEIAKKCLNKAMKTDRAEATELIHRMAGLVKTPDTAYPAHAQAQVQGADVDTVAQEQADAAENVAVVEDLIRNERMIVPVIIPPTRAYRNDTQSAHDSLVVKTLKQSIQNLKRAVKIEQQPMRSLDILKNIIQRRAHSAKNANALKVLESVSTYGEELTSLGITELEALNLVWHRIDGDEDKINNLIDELASGVEHDKVVCTMGRLSRIVNSLNGVDKIVFITHTNTIRKEIMDAAPILRKTLLSTYSASDRKAIDGIADHPIQAEFDEKFKSALSDKIRKDYLHKNLITEAQAAELVVLLTC